jgi:hypothetical protein
MKTETIRPIERPSFRNEHLHDYILWLEDNALTLQLYWRQLGIGLGLSSDDEEEFGYWLKCEWDIETLRACRRPVGVSLQ